MRKTLPSRLLDAIIAIVALTVLVAVGLLGWSVLKQRQSVARSTPIALAASDLERQVRARPGDIKLRMDLAQAYVVAGRDAEAKAQYSAVLRAKRDYIPALCGIGFLAAKSREWKTSETYWRKAVDLMSQSPNAEMSKQFETANFYLANTLLEQDRFADAVGYFKRALRTNPTASDTHYLLARAYQGAGSRQGYEGELKMALKFEPSMPEANYDYGVLLLEHGDKGSAAEHFRLSADAAPGRVEPQLQLKRLGPFSARMLHAKRLEKQRPEEALEQARIAVALAPERPDALLLLAGLQHHAGKRKDAAETYARVLQLQPGNAEAQEAMKRVRRDD